MYSLDFRLNLWISILHRFGKSYMNRRLEAHGSAGVFSHLIEILEEKDGINQEQIADLMRVDKGAVARSVKKLEEEGYLRRTEDIEDKRANKVFLTPKARAAMPEIHAAFADWDQKVLEGIPEESRRICLDCLRQMAITASEMDPDSAGNNG